MDGDAMKIMLAVMVGLFVSCKAPVTGVGGVSEAGTALALCAHLDAIGCKQDNCVVTVQRIESTRITDLKEAQLMAATTKAEAIAVGTVVCP